MWETLIWTFFAALLGLGTWAITLPLYTFSRACFLLAAMVFLSRLTWWLLVEKSIDNNSLTYLYMFLIYAIVGIFLVQGFRWVSNHERMSQKGRETGKQAKQLEIIPPMVVQRPWITLEGIKIIKPLVIRERDASITLEITIRNDGPVPASHIEIIPQMVAVPNDGISMHAEVGINQALQISKNREVARQHGGWILAPMKILSQNHVLAIRRAEIISAAKLSKDHNRVFFYIAGYVDYSFPGGTGQTTFNYILNEKDTGFLAIQISPHVVLIEKLNLLDGIHGVYAK